MVFWLAAIGAAAQMPGSGHSRLEDTFNPQQAESKSMAAQKTVGFAVDDSVTFSFCRSFMEDKE